MWWLGAEGEGGEGKGGLLPLLAGQQASRVETPVCDNIDSPSICFMSLTTSPSCWCICQRITCVRPHRDNWRRLLIISKCAYMYYHLFFPSPLYEGKVVFYSHKMRFFHSVFLSADLKNNLLWYDNYGVSSKKLQFYTSFTIGLTI